MDLDLNRSFVNDSHRVQNVPVFPNSNNDNASSSHNDEDSQQQLGLQGKREDKQMQYPPLTARGENPDTSRPPKEQQLQQGITNSDNEESSKDQNQRTSGLIDGEKHDGDA